VEAGKIVLESVVFDLRATLASVVEMFALRAAETGIALGSRVPDSVSGHVRGDPYRVRQVLVNLVGNAVKFTSRGHVVIVVEAVAETADGVTLRLAVEDTGIGIPPDRHAAIFDSFTQADGCTAREYGGSGLGLTISSRLVALMGGTLAVESEPGRGSRFWFELTFARADPAAAPVDVTSPLRAAG
jgi:signal transduction histidine kinase